ncbi:hypothetical protein A2291_04100 [candidate division WOR-1 bacterium RIFOXYB2_FULL_42_35]|uniref:Glycosyltransferase RgtA/B/C/D-like domain-containing protein n=1 Tax=candidate division WOR-1 bacterium RIFOXYC2_FULL_41_25 TaxID=1802586 RepID=A0A1F4TMR7_UNCSA|nr:MAG: hypothetical protein A2247_00940 [candidate division WOR-1 bacterium RIFOXYA2_FULL_41_14]OGC24313.1 MAG: hypothetical protein A2291_04100 [candidate division WOR-1 bacterium RIFOXYB2_FULL_42_35]OGC34015.1 MAG: hypothetical protein A2462_01505 [candidate division WOR-1 bacterium RIFOXYC2_FULL_41_25]OGC43097.1 MAG: hypothetical protein A2548_00775 [candidate division WOR-1 bacterium RIFOXYD2_FULL_41_8]
MNKPLGRYDEGIIVYGAQRVLNGDIPYKDFWTIYSPGQFYVLAFLFKIFGSSILVARLFDSLIRAGLVAAIFLLAKKLSSVWLATLVATLTTFWLGLFGYYGYNAFSGLLLALISINCFFNYFISDRNKPAGLFFCGLLVGLTFLFRHDFAIYLFFVELVILISLFFEGKRVDLKQFVVGCLVVLLPWLGYCCFTGALAGLFSDLFYFVIVVFPRVRSLPFPDLWLSFAQVIKGQKSLSLFLLVNLPVYLPLPIYGWSVVNILKKNRSQGFTNPYFCGQVCLTLFGLLLFNQARIRAGHLHSLPYFFVALVLGVSLLAPLLRRLNRSRKIIVLLFSVILLLYPLQLDKISLVGNFFDTYKTSQHELRRAQSFHVDPFQAKAIQFIDSHVPIGEKIFVGNLRHDRILANDIMFYYLAERESATKYHELHPGSATTLPVQKEIVAALKKESVKYIVLFIGVENREPNMSSISGGVFVLDNFIRANYKLVQQFGPYLVLRNG